MAETQLDFQAHLIAQVVEKEVPMGLGEDLLEN